MDDRTYLLGKLAALEFALEAAISSHPAPGHLLVAFCERMAGPPPGTDKPEIQGYAEGWLAIVTPLLARRISGRPQGAPKQRPPHVH